ncbi:MAG: alpha/beta fold hydrolase, partial [Chloroflexi bacterium]
RRYHTLQQHIQNLAELLKRLNLRPMTLIMEDWGGPFGLSYAIQQPDHIRRLVISNTWAFQDSYAHRLERLVKWTTRPGIAELLFGTLNLTLNVVLQRWTARQLSETVLSAYKIPFRETRQRAALVQFPRMVNITPEHPSAATMRAIESGLASLRDIPALILWGKEDPIFPPDVAAHWKTMLPRAAGPHLIESARHLLTEDAPDAMIEHLNAFFERS